MDRYDREFLPRFPEIGWGTRPTQRGAVLDDYELSTRVTFDIEDESCGDKLDRFGIVVERAWRARRIAGARFLASLGVAS